MALLRFSGKRKRLLCLIEKCSKKWSRRSGLNGRPADYESIGHINQNGLNNQGKSFMLVILKVAKHQNKPLEIAFESNKAVLNS